jgi:hypothetical protein
LPDSNPLSGIDRVPNAQTPDLRFGEHVRRTNFIEPRPNRTTWVHFANWTHDVQGTPIDLGDQVALPATEGTAWGPAIRTLGYERVVLLVDITGLATSIAISAQVSNVGGAATSHWWDYHDDRVAPGALIRRLWTKTVTSPEKIAFTIEPQANYMRFQLWAPGGDATTRGLLQAIRLMNAS